MKGRNTQITNQKAKKNVWHIIDNIQENTIENKSHIYLFFCLGYNEDVPDIKNYINEIREQQKTNPGLSFTVVIYPNPHNPTKVSEWLEEHAELIQNLGNRFSSIEDWRKKNADSTKRAHQAFYALYEKNEALKKRIDDMLDKDISRFVNVYKISREEAIQYVINEVIDCIALMELKSSSDENKLSVLNILYYEKPLYHSIAFAIGSGAIELGYKPQSLIHAQSINNPTIQANYKIKNGHDDADNYFLFVNNFAINLSSTVPPEYLAKFIKAAYLEWPPNNHYGRFFQPLASKQDATYNNSDQPILTPKPHMVHSKV